ncbi:hypothetical protein LAZ67_1001988 [Cordylochernes scorpioides]|uniref:Uncharacterized protein n=1 Tax=Cordylochernes scorpioides TaxID=51811 RepID=A0ABY6JW01_9ARAC|nr:hypothetical protein LAZ67_1001988 [Cordylochernes scorpioides]
MAIQNVISNLSVSLSISIERTDILFLCPAISYSHITFFVSGTWAVIRTWSVSTDSVTTSCSTIKSKCLNDIRRNFWTDLREIRPILCGDLSPRMRHGFTTTHQKPNSSRWKPLVQRQRKRNASYMPERLRPVLNINITFLTQLDVKICDKRPGLRQNQSSFVRTTHLLPKVYCNVRTAGFEIRFDRPSFLFS